MGSEAECKVWLLGGVTISVDSGSMLGAGDGLEGPGSEARESSGCCVWDVSAGEASTEVSSGRGLGLTPACGAGEDGRDSVGAAGVEEG